MLSSSACCSSSRIATTNSLHRTLFCSVIQCYFSPSCRFFLYQLQLNFYPLTLNLRCSLIQFAFIHFLNGLPSDLLPLDDLAAAD